MNKAPNSLIDNISDTLKTRILRGEYQGGSKLSENMISREFGCSRTPVREALKSLEQDNLVEIHPHSGTYVKALTDRENLEITEIRSYLEALAFHLACEKKADTRILRTLCEEMSAILDSDDPDFIGYGKVHYLFHRHLVELSGNEKLISLYSRLNLNIASRLIYRSMSREEIESTEKEHFMIVEALEERNTAEGEKFMFNHLWKKRDRLRKELELT